MNVFAVSLGNLGVLLIVLLFAVGYAVLMNFLGGEKHLLFNRVRETISNLRK